MVARPQRPPNFRLDCLRIAIPASTSTGEITKQRWQRRCPKSSQWLSGAASVDNVAYESDVSCVVKSCLAAGYQKRSTYCVVRRHKSGSSLRVLTTGRNCAAKMRRLERVNELDKAYKRRLATRGMQQCRLHLSVVARCRPDISTSASPLHPV